MLRLEGPLQSWGNVAFDPRRPTRAFPSRSALAGLLANALGWEHRDGERTTGLQDALRYGVREDVPPRLLRDYQTADLERIGKQGWTRWGIERRGGGSAEGTQILEKFYLADGSLLVALSVGEESTVTLGELAEALHRPARPLFLGRKGCPPSMPLLEGGGGPGGARMRADTAYTALERWPLRDRPDAVSPCRCWYSPGDGPDATPGSVQEVWDRRDYLAQRFTGSRRIVQGQVTPREAS